MIMDPDTLLRLIGACGAVYAAGWLLAALLDRILP